MKIRRKVDPEKWPLPGLALPNQTHTDFSQLINCPEFVPRQLTEEPQGESCHPGSRSSGSLKVSAPHALPCAVAAGSPRDATPVKQKTKNESDSSNLKTMPKGLSASLPDLDSESWIEVKKRPRPSPARPKVSPEKVTFSSSSSSFISPF